MVAKNLQLVVKGRMKETPASCLTLWNHPGNDGKTTKHGQSKINPTPAEEKRIPHLQSEAIPEAT